jgi:S-DNA-T family DNA segregation ATPase FtsK/SpoIIIE
MVPMVSKRRPEPAVPPTIEEEEPEAEPTSGPLVGLLLLGFAALLALALAIPGGSVGAFLRGGLGFGLGWASYLLPVVVAAFAVIILRSVVDSDFAPGRLERPGWVVLALALSGLLQALAGDPAPSWGGGQGGGWVGRSVWEAADNAFGVAAGEILLGGVALVGLVLVLRLTVADLWHGGAWGLAFLGRLAGRGLRLAARGAASLLRAAAGPRRPPAARAFRGREEDDEPAPAEAEPLPRTAAAPLLARRPVSGGGWETPSVSVLRAGSTGDLSQTELARKVSVIEGTLADFDVYAKVVSVNPGPTVTQFGLEPGFRERRDRRGEVVQRQKIKVSEIMSLQNDLALALAAPSIRIEAPVPGRQVVGLEVPNGQTAVVTLRQVIESTAFQKLRAKTKLALALGEDVSGQPVAADLARAPHLLIAGATGSGKSICINAIISCLLLQATPDEVRLILVDPKRVEMTAYNDVPHLLRPVVVEVDKVVGVLKWVVKEMDERYKLFEAHGVRNVEGYNRLAQPAAPPKAADAGAPGLKPLPFIVVIIDELADLMMLAPDDTERLICRLAQLARATGIHLVVATQRPSVDVITGLIKANFPTRISFAVTSQIDSRTILDMPGAEKLLGRGDMLFMPTDAAKPYRLQGVYVSEEEIEAITSHWRAQGPANYVEPLVEMKDDGDDEEADELYDKAAQLAREHTRISTSLLQRRLRIGYTRAARLMDLLEQKGVVGPAEGGGRSREVNHEQRAELEPY